MTASNRIEGLSAFVAVYETRSFTRAGQRLGVPRSTMSRTITALEGRLDRALFHRTTRRVAPTREADALYDRVAPALRTLEAAVDDGPTEGEPSGHLRVASTVDIGAEFLALVVQRYVARYPKVQVEMDLSHDTVDLVKERIDVALRVWMKRPRSGNLKARKLGKMQMGVYAAPSYVARVGPLDPEGDHPWITHRGGDVSDAQIVCNDMFVCRALLRAGGGVGFLPAFVAHEDVQRGTLIPVLPSLRSDRGALYLVRPDQPHLPRRVRLFQELVRDMFHARQFAPG